MILETPYLIINPVQLVLIMRNLNAFSMGYNFELHASTSSTSPGLSIDSSMPIFDSTLVGKYFLVALACNIIVAGASASQIRAMTGSLISYIFLEKNRCFESIFS